MNSKPSPLGFPSQLRTMRTSLGVSQMELAFRLGISQRHLSFVERGRARPSRDLVLRWSRETGASTEDRNAALLGAGYAPAFREFGAEQVRETPGFKALSEMLVAHEPYPGIVFNADWMINAMTEGGQWLCAVGMQGFLESMTGPPSQMDMIAALVHPDGMLSRVRNAPEVGYALLRQLRSEQLARPSLGPRVDGLEASLVSRYGTDGIDQPRAAGEPYLRVIMDTGPGELCFLLVQTVFGLPHSISAASLRTELWFPTNERTRRVMATRS
jgi:transcriptional regulator with XRE-family HTH domain